ncbi:hypothetical protein B9Z55_017296 [Caenorhabditis nigoni]|uniref:7TM GPCR serpentine receptor class x (Srx) domain-containing protein n=1 Tax=Caenorhabditis nigoni TaxID=1611254 RepID=A0A2G5T988_9PELO|nr:hypothetical protein B9Z55_017296 [Caenorhabditis nigoni]
MAVNRVCIITFKKYKIFTFKFTIIIFIAFLILASILTTLTQYIFPCCPYVIQFVFISVFYVCTWVFFEVFPKVVPKDIIEYFWIITIMVILNASSNSVIFLTCNQDVKRSVNFPWTKKTIYTTTALSKFSKATVHN